MLQWRQRMRWEGACARRKRTMAYRFVSIVWTLFWLTCAGGLLYLRTQPLPEEWLLTHGTFVRVVADYAQVEPAMKRWRAGVPSMEGVEEFLQQVGRRPYALLSEEGLEELSKRMSPDAVNGCVRRIKTVLLAPCSREMKSQVVTDPFGLAWYARRLITPALTSRVAALYVCIEGETKESTLAGAESAARVLDKMAADGLIGGYQGVTAFMASQDRQTVRYAEFTQLLKSYELVATMERALEQEGVDREVVKEFLGHLRLMGTQGAGVESVTSQENRLRMLGMMPTVRYFFYRTPRGYMSVQRVLGVKGVSLAAMRERIEQELGRVYVRAIVTGPEYFAGVYYGVLRVGLWLCCVVWGLGMTVLAIRGIIGEYVRWLVLGRRAELETRGYECAPGYKAYFSACGLEGLEEALEVERIPGVEVEVLERLPGDEYAPVQRGVWGRLLVMLPMREELPEGWSKASRCRLIWYRGYGAAAVELKREYRVYRQLEQRGVPLLPLVLFTHGTRHGKECAVLVYAWPDGYTPIIAWQARRLMGAGEEREQLREEFMREVYQLVQALRAARCVGWARERSEFVVREDGNGGISVCLSGAAGLEIEGMVERLLSAVWPRARRRRDEVLVYMNRSLLREVYGTRERVQKLARLKGVRGSLRVLRPLIRRIREESREKGYRQYAEQGGGVEYNRAVTDQLAKCPVGGYQGFMGMEGEELVTRKRGRTVVTVRVGGQRWYLKRHTGVSLWEACVRLMRGEGGTTEAEAEWRGVQLLEEEGIASVPLVAMGRDVRWGFWERGSFVVTGEVSGGRSLEKLLEGGMELSWEERVRLTKRLGRLARRLHEAGWVHRDFYLGHIYVVGDVRGAYRLHVLDVQRLRRGARVGNRWSCKDITALYFSSLRLRGVSATDRMRFLATYLGAEGARRAWRHRFARRVMKKAERVARHTEKLLARRRARGEIK
ncbi:MAG: hypothetical protein N2595_00710 [bacterium]|nr:hypothetical protein [bacterium]